MGAGGVGERKALVDLDPDLARRDDLEQRRSCGLELGRIGDVGEQGRAGQVEAALCANRRREGAIPPTMATLTSARAVHASNERSKVSLPTESYTTGSFGTAGYAASRHNIAVVTIDGGNHAPLSFVLASVIPCRDAGTIASSHWHMIIPTAGGGVDQGCVAGSCIDRAQQHVRVMPEASSRAWSNSILGAGDGPAVRLDQPRSE